MKLRQKYLFLAVAPLVLAMLAIALAVLHQANALLQHQHTLVEAACLQSKQAELRHYVDLAKSAIAPLVQSGRDDDAMRALARLNFGQDGYFFLYDLQGHSLMHPRQPELVGRDLSQLRDSRGRLTIQPLLAAANRGGGTARYRWRKPSTGHTVPKLGYVISIPQWNWMIGTGIYLDDVEHALHRINARAAADIRKTMAWTGSIAAVVILVVAAGGFALSVSEHRRTDEKLRQLAQRVVQSQEDERARLSRDLHDGISQSLVSVKLLVDTALVRLKAAEPTGGRGAAAAQPGRDTADLLNIALDRLNHAFNESRRIARALRPALLDDLGLQAAIEQLARDMQNHDDEPAGLAIDVMVTGTPRELPDDQATALFRIAQEALTNVKRHADASRVSIFLVFLPRATQLEVHDNGRGFDVAALQHDPHRGVGLRNMAERMDALGGAFDASAGALGTRLVATVPYAAPRQPAGAPA
ncbi:hypothetical protein DFQ28_008668 [Apophysomyces sp. BC1034]|nr:hypothetical protein DFQ28_008668 [Apophysomyces sp. BC1034]